MANNILTQLTISKWTPRKISREATATVEQTYSAPKAGKFVKKLIDSATLRAIAAKDAEIRAAHYKYSLPWDDMGTRIVPPSLVEIYIEKTTTLKDEFNVLVGKFVQEYPSLVWEAEFNLGRLYDHNDYPAQGVIKDKFGVKVVLSSMPDHDNLFAGVFTDQFREITRQEEESRIEKTFEDIRERVKALVDRVLINLKGDKNFHESMMEDVKELSRLIPNLNIFGSSNISAIGDALADCYADTEELKNNDLVKDEVIARAELLKDML